MTNKSNTKKANPLFVASLEKGMRILEAFDEGHRRLSLTEMVKITGLNKSAVQRFLHTWEELGYIIKDSKTKLISLSPKTMSLGYNFLRSERLVEVATPFLLEARELTGNSAYLGTLYDTSIIYLIRLPQRLLVLEGTLPGRRVPAFCGGRAFLSCLDDSEILEILQRSERPSITPYTITDIDEIMKEIELVRKKGFCISMQEQLIGEIAVSAPILDRDGTPRAAVYISARISEWTEERAEKELAPAVLEAAARIGSLL
ncbi:IclR family transcriptional regulator C-terminal domain-containing protein [Maridesulfovibrio sp.]|uniref:IclR family transcriptional regulator n=1 Tax=Maridesulfovibrio sp. TaxID=2795000 RepID=UPI0029CA2FEA|nr:IclR family transcriptional regulator C-terminal domain-containing protein [Maridesulfovibrio sp.]